MHLCNFCNFSFSQFQRVSFRPLTDKKRKTQMDMLHCCSVLILSTIFTIHLFIRWPIKWKCFLFKHFLCANKTKSQMHDFIFWNSRLDLLKWDQRKCDGLCCTADWAHAAQLQLFWKKSSVIQMPQKRQPSDPHDPWLEELTSRLMIHLDTVGEQGLVH